MNPLIGFLVEHFIEILFIVGFSIFSIIYKLYHFKKCCVVYAILFFSLLLITYDGVLKLTESNLSYLLLLYIALINICLCSYVVFPIKKIVHIFLLMPYVIGALATFVFSELTMLILAGVSLLYFLLILVYTIIRHIVKKIVFESTIIEIFSVVNIICLWLQQEYPTTKLVNEIVVISTIVVFTTLVAKSKSNEKVEDEKRIQTQRTSIAISQIQPHFLYNSLATIGYICKKDPIKASEAIDKFSDYLRANLNSLRNEKNIPFKEELKHVETYLWLEKLRFDDRLTIIYDINVDNFLVPPLSVQPLVENAVKHGICEKIEGGTLYIRTIEYNEKIKIVIEDTGVGFDIKSKPNDGKTHVGIENVGARIKSMANGELDIKSEIGKGTISTITLPKELTIFKSSKK